MLTNLVINNIVLIQKLDIALKDGFCVLTGETGAGKSILLDALGLAIGKRASASLVRSGQKQGNVVAVFDIRNNAEVQNILDEQAIEHDGEIAMRRVVYSDGKSKAFVNDVAVGAGLLTNLSEKLIEIHGQHDQRGVLNVATHRSVIDSYGQLENEIKNTSDIFKKYKQIKLELESLRENEAKIAAEEDYLKFVLNELESLDITPGIESELTEKRNIMLGRDKLIEAVGSSLDILQSGDIEKSINQVQSLLLKHVDINENFALINDMLERASIEINEAASQLNAEASKIDEADENIDAIEERLFAIKAAAKKYGRPSDELSAYADEIRGKLDLIENKEQNIQKLENDLKLAKEQYINSANILSERRKKSALKIEKAIAAELRPLKMENTSLLVNFEKTSEENWGEKGFDKILFMVRTNPGSPYAPIAKIASGGELSRFMLALKVVLSEVKSVPAMIFDEVDTGIGGAVAEAVGKRLKVLGERLQVFAITHQPQVAACGGFHLKVKKHQSKEGTTTNVEILSEQERHEELARMLAGENITGEARAAAAKLLEPA